MNLTGCVIMWTNGSAMSSAHQYEPLRGGASLKWLPWTRWLLVRSTANTASYVIFLCQPFTRSHRGVQLRNVLWIALAFARQIDALVGELLRPGRGHHNPAALIELGLLSWVEPHHYVARCTFPHRLTKGILSLHVSTPSNREYPLGLTDLLLSAHCAPAAAPRAPSHPAGRKDDRIRRVAHAESRNGNP